MIDSDDYRQVSTDVANRLASVCFFCFPMISDRHCRTLLSVGFLPLNDDQRRFLLSDDQRRTAMSRQQRTATDSDGQRRTVMDSDGQ